MFNFPVEVVGIKHANKPVEKGMAFHALVFNYVIVVANLFQYGNFVYFALKRVDVCNSSVWYIMFSLVFRIK